MPSRGEVESVRGGGTVTFDFQVDPGLLNGADIVLSVSGIVNTLAASGPPPSGAVVATSSDVQLRGAGGVPIYARHLASGASIAGPLADSFVDSFSFIGLPGTTYVLTIQADSTALQLSTWAEAASASTFAALSAVARAPTPPPDGGSGGVAVPAPAGLPVLALALTALSGCRRRLRAG